MERFRLDDTITIPELNVEVFIRTQLIYPDSSKECYETMAFSMDRDKNLCLGKCYRSEEDARKGHQKLIERLQTGKCELIPVKWKIKLVE